MAEPKKKDFKAINPKVVKIFVVDRLNNWQTTIVRVTVLAWRKIHMQVTAETARQTLL